MLPVCQTAIPTWFVGPVWLGFVMFAIGLVSGASLAITRVLLTLPRIVSSPFIVPAVIWHEMCHLAVCLVFGLKVEKVQLWGNSRTGQPAHVQYRYNAHSASQAIGRTLSGWAPVLVSLALLAFIRSILDSLALPATVAACYGMVILALAMPLSAADWYSAIDGLLIALPVSVAIGVFLAPPSTNVCRIGHQISSIVLPIFVLLAVLWVVTAVLSASQR